MRYWLYQRSQTVELSLPPATRRKQALEPSGGLLFIDFVAFLKTSSLLPDRISILIGIPRSKYKRSTIANRPPDLVYEYYRLSGRHERTGRPFKETLDKLGLEEFTPWSQEASQL